jgi:hypothetical protein
VTDPVKYGRHAAKAYETVSAGAVEPKVKASATAGAGAALVVTPFLLWASGDQVQQWAVASGGIVMAVGTLLAVVLPVAAAYAARAQVTPLASPRSVDGQPLIAAGDTSPSMGPDL